MPASAEEKLDYLLSCLSTIGPFKPDYKAMVAKYKISNANVAQKKFKAIVEDNNQFKLVDGEVQAVGGPAPVATPKTPNKPRKKTADTDSASKKRKISAVGDDAEQNAA